MPTEARHTILSLTDEPVLTDNARKVLEARYLKKDETGRCLERPGDLFRRVAKTVAEVELLYTEREEQRAYWETQFYRMMATGRFMPNSPTLMNAGREMGMLSACFVLPVRDSIVDIFDSVKHTAMIQKAGGGTGFAFDELRPTGDFIKSSGGNTSGPISFWKAFSEATNAIQQGAFRRGANMGMMYIHHPDIVKFLHAKQDLAQFTNYNISVKVTDTWMDEFVNAPDSPHVVRNPRTGKAYAIPREVPIWKYTIRDLVEIECVEPVAPAGREKYYRTPRLTGQLPEPLRGKVYTKREIWKTIINNAWQTGEPGVVFMDRINEFNPTPQLGRIEATNPCGEQPLLPYEACNLGSVNLGVFIKNAGTPEAAVDWDALRETVHDATRFLDNVIDANNYPLPEIEHICRANRKIGLGIMGFADALFKLGVPYNSEEGVGWGRRFMKFVNDEGHNCSEQLARERGCFDNWPGSLWQTRYNRMMRNAAVTTVAPTGTISIIANCSGGIEPLFSLAFMRNVLRGQTKGDRPLIEVNEVFRDVAQRRGFYSDELLEEIFREGTLAHLDAVPDDVKRMFVCAHDISPEWHMRMQAGFQEHCDASISKTINFAEDASREEVEKIYRLAYELRCKGVTVYRNNCRSFQPMALKDKNEAGGKTAAEATTDQGSSETDVATSATRDASAAATETSPAGAAPPSSAPERPRPEYIEPMDLPEIVSGFRIRQMTPFGNMHVKITVDPHSERELEIFAQLGKGGDVANSDLEGLCRTASLWLRAGGSVVPLIRQWEGIGTSMSIPTRAGRIMSLPDGLACALKKYLRAKERFGLRALLLGEIDPAEMDNPRPAPHAPATTPMDRPVQPAPAQPRAVVAPTVVSAVERRIEASATLPTSQKIGGKSQTPKARLADAGGNGNGQSHGDDGGGVAVVELEDTSEALRTIDNIELRSETTLLDAHEAVLAEVSADDSAVGLDVAAVLATVRHNHDSAQHYRVMCPECGQPLAIQEGCRKCVSCGWAAC